MGAARSYPPPAFARPSNPASPGFALRRPSAFELLVATAAILRRLIDAGHVSVRDLAEWWQCPVSHAQDKLRAERPIHLGEVLALPDRLSLDVLDEARLVVLQRRTATRSVHR